MKLISTFVITLFLSLTAHAADIAHIEQAAAAPSRNAANVDRDKYRHPVETLAFFGIRKDMQVLEILPGRGWYTEILAPLLQDEGQLTVASFGEEHESDYLRKVHLDYMDMLDASPDVYGKVKRVVFEQDGYLNSIAPNSQDMVLTFRSTHNWIRYGNKTEEVYKSFYRVLKKGGVLGVVQHRAAEGSDSLKTAEKGYVTEKYLINMLEDIGFELVAKSEVNANPLDTRDHPDGVWALPPSLRSKDGNKDRYLAIGESDRMTLRFVKL